MQEINLLKEALKKGMVQKYDNHLTLEEKQILKNEKYVETYNNTIGNLPYTNCEICKNKGHIMVVDKKDATRHYIKKCSCMSERESIERFKKSGLEALRQKYTFSKFNRYNEKTKKLYEKAKEFLKNKNEKNWFFIGGQVGSGKSHLCTAMSLELLKNNQVKFMEWVKESTILKSLVLDDINYTRELSKLLYVDILYIDDFFKGGINKADIRLAFEIINYRYNNDLVTIISSEKSINEILEIDEAIGSRIYEKSYNFTFEIEKDEELNYRLRERGQKI
ncbi:DnaA ATPase domain-containing protein [[Clostridium] colinum]|uniref:DnaA ATPase domain-containing protein n=1 Tax=[Clostridium] colinum TaxID=36835 RepID=UPI0020252796|nr:DnaA/Hda family protein [[Clostridium] colinum]